MWNTLMPRSMSASNTLFLNLNSQNLSCICTSGKWFITVFMKCAHCNRLFHLLTLHRWGASMSDVKHILATDILAK